MKYVPNKYQVVIDALKTELHATKKFDALFLMAFIVCKCQKENLESEEIVQSISCVESEEKAFRTVIKSMKRYQVNNASSYKIFGELGFTDYFQYILPNFIQQIKEVTAILESQNQPIWWMIWQVYIIKKLSALLGAKEGRSFEKYNDTIGTATKLSEEDFYKAYDHINSYVLPPVKQLAAASALYDNARKIEEQLAKLHNEDHHYLEYVTMWLDGKTPESIAEEYCKEPSDLVVFQENLKMALQQMQRTPLISQIKWLSMDANHTDQPLELGFVLPNFLKNLSQTLTDTVLIIDPSPEFVDAWTIRPELKTVKTNCVFTKPYMASLMSHLYKSGKHVNRDVSNMEFFHLNEFTATKELQQTYLIFGCDMDASQYQAYRGLILENANHFNVRPKVISLISTSGQDSIRKLQDYVGAEANLCSVDMIPLGIARRRRPIKKFVTLDQVDGNQTTDVQLFNYHLVSKDAETKLVPMEATGITLFAEDIKVHSDKTLRAIFATKQKALIKERKRIQREAGKSPTQIEGYRNEPRDKATEYEIFPELSVWYTESDEKGSIRYRAYFRQIRSSDTGDFVPTIQFKKSIKSVTTVSQDELPQWLEKDYLNEVQSAAITHFQPVFNGRAISIKLFRYLHPDQFAQLHRDNEAVLLQLVTGDLGRCKLDSTAEKFHSVIENTSFSKSAITKNDIWIMLDDILDIAVKTGNLPENHIKEVAEEQVKKVRNTVQEIRGALVKKSFSPMELQKIYNGILEKIEKGETEYLGVLIALTAGLHADMVCALRWKDFVVLEKQGISQLLIHGKMNEAGDMLPLRNDEQYRKLPCIPILQQYLLEQRNHVHKTRYKNQRFSALDDVPIVITAKQLDNLSALKTFYNPKLLKQLINEMIKLADIRPQTVQVTDENGAPKTVELDRYQGDILRENYRYYLRESQLDVDEIAYLLGNKAPTTFGQYYCDWQNDRTQYTLFQKLLGFQAILNDEVVPAVTKKDIHQKSYSGTLGKQGLIRITLEQPNTTAMVTIHSKHGIQASASPLKEE